MLNQNFKKMASLSTKTFRAFNEITGLNIVTVKGSNAIDVINKITPLLDEGGVAYEVGMMLKDMVNHYDPYLCGSQNLVTGYEDCANDISYIFCANTGRFLTVLSSYVMEEMVCDVKTDTHGTSVTCDFLKELGATA